MTAKKKAAQPIIPVWGYRKGEDGLTESRLFQAEGGRLPKGWADTPAALAKDADK